MKRQSILTAVMLFVLSFPLSAQGFAKQSPVPASEMAVKLKDQRNMLNFLKHGPPKTNKANYNKALKTMRADIKTLAARAEDSRALAEIIKIGRTIKGLDLPWRLRDCTFYENVERDVPGEMTAAQKAKLSKAPVFILHDYPIKIWFNRTHRDIREGLQALRDYELLVQLGGKDGIKIPLAVYVILIDLGHEDYHDRLASVRGRPPENDEEERESEYCALAEGDNRIINLLFNQRRTSFSNWRSLREENNWIMAKLKQNRVITCPLLPPRQLAPTRN